MADPSDPRVTTTDGPATPDTEPGPAPGPIDPATGQHTSYWILTAEQRAHGFVRPVRASYEHTTCRTRTTMAASIAETWSRDPKFYGCTFCVQCRDHLPVGEFVWVVNDITTTEVLGS